MKLKNKTIKGQKGDSKVGGMLKSSSTKENTVYLPTNAVICEAPHSVVVFICSVNSFISNAFMICIINYYKYSQLIFVRPDEPGCFVLFELRSDCSFVFGLVFVAFILLTFLYKPFHSINGCLVLMNPLF